MPDYIINNIWLLVALVAWSFVWKGLALWRSAKRDEKVWFIVLLLVNTVGILEIYYLFRGRRAEQPVLVQP